MPLRKHKKIFSVASASHQNRHHNRNSSEQLKFDCAFHLFCPQPSCNYFAPFCYTTFPFPLRYLSLPRIQFTYLPFPADRRGLSKYLHASCHEAATSPLQKTPPLPPPHPLPTPSPPSNVMFALTSPPTQLLPLAAISTVGHAFTAGCNSIRTPHNALSAKQASTSAASSPFMAAAVLRTATPVKEVKKSRLDRVATERNRSHNRQAFTRGQLLACTILRSEELIPTAPTMKMYPCQRLGCFLICSACRSLTRI